MDLSIPYAWVNLDAVYDLEALMGRTYIIIIIIIWDE